jgi:hypothetical protein
MKLRRILAQHVSHMGEIRNAYIIFVGKYERNSLGIDGKIILEWIFGILCGKVWNGVIWLRIETSGRPN